MTTIVVDRKERVMVADRQTTAGNHRYFAGGKLLKTDSYIIGHAGLAEAGVAFRIWYAQQLTDPVPENKDDHYPKTDEFHAIVLHMDRTLSWYGKHGYPVPVKERYFAIGSGSDYALGAISAGASLEAAVRIASKYDPMTGMGLQIERL